MKNFDPSNLAKSSTLENLRTRFATESITVAQLASITREHEGTIRNALSAGEYPIPSFKAGSKRLFFLLDVASFVDACRQQAVIEAAAAQQAKAIQKLAVKPRRRGRPRKAEQLQRQQ